MDREEVLKKIDRAVMLSNRMDTLVDDFPARLNTLTDAEMAILYLIGRGLSNLECCRVMFVAPDTIKTHIKHIKDKLAIDSQRRLAITAHKVFAGEL
jgi:LuxR family maltose regulon positive regulatory protein